MASQKEDVIEYTILEDGTIKYLTDSVSGANHTSADALMEMTSDLGGGGQIRKARTDRKTGAVKGSTTHKHSH